MEFRRERGNQYLLMNDKELLKLIAEQDVKAFEVLLERYEFKVFSFCKKIIKDPASSEEITQDVFLQIWHQANLMTNIDSLISWIYRIAKNKSINEIKRKVSQLNREQIFAHEQPQSTEVEVAPSSIDVASDILKNFILKLPEKARLVFELKVFENLSNDEIALKLNISSHTVKNQLTTCYRKLRHYLTVPLLIALFEINKFTFF